jgi:hypothetical protein
MPPTTCLHDGITHPILQQTDLIFHNPIAFDSANRVFNPHADGREPTILCLLRWGEFTATRFFLGLTDGHPREKEALDALSLIQTTAGWQRIARQLRQALIRRFALTGRAQGAHVTRFIHHKEVFERVAFLLATVALLLFLRVFRTVDWPFRTIMPKRGSVDPSFNCVVVSNAAHSSAVWAGSRFWCAHA